LQGAAYRSGELSPCDKMTPAAPNGYQAHDSQLPGDRDKRYNSYSRFQFYGVGCHWRFASASPVVACGSKRSKGVCAIRSVANWPFRAEAFRREAANK